MSDSSSRSDDLVNSSDVRIKAGAIRSYAAFLRMILRPGESPPFARSTPVIPGKVGGWSKADLQILLDEGRRTLDRLVADIDRTRDRAQITFTTGLGLLVVMAAQLPSVRGHVWVLGLIYALGASVSLLGVIGALAVFVVDVEIDVISVDMLSTYDPPILVKLAQDYADSVARTVSARDGQITMLRASLLLLSLGSLCDGGAWLAVHAT